MLLLRNRPDIL